jgi:hypothetical protein
MSNTLPVTATCEPLPGKCIAYFTCVPLKIQQYSESVDSKRYAKAVRSAVTQFFCTNSKFLTFSMSLHKSNKVFHFFINFLHLTC